MLVAAELARWAVALQPDQVPVDVEQAARCHLLDGVGCLLAGLRTGVVNAAITVATDLGGPPEATVIGTASRLSAPGAAFANGALVHGLDFDDTHAEGLVHATAVVLPAAFGVGEQVGASGRDILTAAVVGYETICRVAAASPHGFHERGLHATQVAGVFAAALTTARLLALGADRTTDALGIAGSSAGGLLEFLTTGASTKQLHPGSAASAGIMAARLAAAGASGPSSVFEGTNGLYAALSARPADPARIVEGLGSRWETTRITIKRYPCCQLSQSSIQVLVAAAADEPLAAADIAEIVVQVHPDSIPVVCEPAAAKVYPRTSYDAKFSLPWTLAALLIDGAITIDTYSKRSIARPEVADLARRVRAVAASADGAAADAPGHVVIHLRDGREIVRRQDDASTAIEHPHLAEAAVRHKLLGNVGGTPRMADAIAAAVDGLGRGTELPDLLRAAGAASAATSPPIGATP